MKLCACEMSKIHTFVLRGSTYSRYLLNNRETSKHNQTNVVINYNVDLKHNKACHCHSFCRECIYICTDTDIQ